MTPAGYLHVFLPWENQGGVVQIKSTRPQHVHRLFCNKSLPYTLQTIPLLLNVCRHAQTVATARAIEQALDFTPHNNTEQTRNTLVSTEALHEHLWKLLIDLPPLLGLPARQQEMAKVNQQLKPLLDQLHHSSNLKKLTATSPKLDGDQMRLNSELTHELSGELKAELRTLLFGQTAQLEGSWNDLLDGSGLAGSMLRTIAPRDWSTTTHIHQLPTIKSTEKQGLLSSQDSHQFINQYASSDHNNFDTGALARMLNHPLIKQVNEEQNQCLSMRLMALLVETDLLLRDEKYLQQNNQSISLAPNQGYSEVETARGRLTYTLSVEKNESSEPTIKQIAVIAPTDWNFHPHGIACHQLSEIPSTHKDQQHQCAELLIQLINPCVAYQLDTLNKHSQDSNSQCTPTTENTSYA